MQENERQISQIKQRILKYLDNKGVSKYEFYKESGIARGVLDNSSGITEDGIARFIAYASDVNPTWLLTGFGQMLTFSEVPLHVAEDKVTYSENSPVSGKKAQAIPMYEIDAAASLTQIFGSDISQIPIGSIQIPRMPKCDGAVNIVGDSMYPLLKSGDIVLFQKLNDKRNIQWGKMYLMYINNFGDEYFCVKYVQRGDDPSTVRLVSSNQHHDPMEVPIDSIIQIATVKASIRFEAQI